MQYTAIVFITELAAIILMVSVHGNSFLPIARRHSFLLLLAILMVTNAAEWLAACLDGAPAGLRTLHIFAKFMELTLTTAIPMVGVLAIGEHQRVKWLAIPAGVNFILQLLSLHFGFVFAVDAQNGDFSVQVTSPSHNEIQAQGQGHAPFRGPFQFEGTLTGDPNVVERLPNIMDKNARLTGQSGVVALHFP